MDAGVIFDWVITQLIICIPLLPPPHPLTLNFSLLSSHSYPFLLPCPSPLLFPVMFLYFPLCYHLFAITFPLRSPRPLSVPPVNCSVNLTVNLQVFVMFPFSLPPRLSSSSLTSIFLYISLHTFFISSPPPLPSPYPPYKW